MPFRIVDRLPSIRIDHTSLLSTRTRVTAAPSKLAIVAFFDASDVAPVLLSFEAQTSPVLWRAAPVLIDVLRATE